MIRTLTFLASGSLFLAFAQNPCDKLKATSFPDSTITAVESVAAGPARNFGRGGGGAPPADAPGWARRGRRASSSSGTGQSRCTSSGGWRPGSGSRAAGDPARVLPRRCHHEALLRFHIEMEVWMPAENWNGKFQTVGNGGWAGTISFAAMAGRRFEKAMRRLRTTPATRAGPGLRAGPSGETGGFRLSRECMKWWCKSKAIITAFYGKGSEAVLLERLLHRRHGRA